MFLRPNTSVFCHLVIGFILFSFCSLSEGADYPRKMIRIVVPSEAGGQEDTEARGIAPFAEKHLGVSLMIENQIGAGGKIAFEKFYKTEPNGYTLLTYTFPKTIIHEYMGKTTYKTRDFTQVFIWSRSGDQALVVHPETFKTFDEFLQASKTRALSGGLSGRGTITHVVGLLMVDRVKLKVNWVPFDSAPGSLAALAGKHIDFSISRVESVLPLVKAGKLRPLVVFGEKRDPTFPDTPIPKELGFTIPSVPSLRGIEAPPKTPPSIVNVLEEAFFKATKEPAYLDWAKKRVLNIEPLSAKEYAKVVESTYPEIEKLKELLKGE